MSGVHHKAHRLMSHSTLGLRVITRRNKKGQYRGELAMMRTGSGRGKNQPPPRIFTGEISGGGELRSCATSSSYTSILGDI